LEIKKAANLNALNNENKVLNAPVSFVPNSEDLRIIPGMINILLEI
jgi:hypothetical protein